MPKTEIVPVLIGVATATKGLQQIVGHVCRDLVGIDPGTTTLFLRFSDYPSPTEPGKEQVSAPQWKVTLVKRSMTIIYTKLTEFALICLKIVHVISPRSFAQEVAEGQRASDDQ